ncbi:MAG: hypothetical protein K5988_00720 [Lachnospiraceae bacterium]|nr:hypothetical protein [Lachnospiraceae bacterium]
MKRSKKITVSVFTFLIAGSLLTGCYNPVESKKTGKNEVIKPIDTFDTKEEKEYTEEGEKAEVITEFETSGGICKVKVTEAYFDVTLDEEKASAFDAGRAYGEAINMIYPEFGSELEPYLFENIRGAFPNLNGDNYKAVEDRMHGLFDSLDDHYKDEIKGLAEGIGTKSTGIVPDGILSTEELMLAQMVPDALRGTACSGLSLWGEKTATGDMIGVRCLEWSLGSERSMCKIHTVLHIKNGDKSITSFGFLGLFDVISGVNDDGVFAAMLDMYTDEVFIYEGRTCYSFAIRHALEEFSTAKETGKYMVDNSSRFTFSHNVMITDGKEAYCAEDPCPQAVEEGKAFPSLRDCSTPLMKELKWESKDSLCMVNSFVTKGNFDLISGHENSVNSVRFAKYNKWVKERSHLDAKGVKEMMTQEVVETDLYGSSTVQNVHRDNLTQMIVIDYHNGSIQVAFTGTEGVIDKPVFYEAAKLPCIKMQ